MHALHAYKSTKFLFIDVGVVFWKIIQSVFMEVGKGP